MTDAPGARVARVEELHFQGALCDACAQVFPQSQLDEDRWCGDCRPRMQRRMRRWRHVIAACITFPFAVWVVIWLRRFPEVDYLPAFAWALPLTAAYYLGFRIGREVVKGYGRWRRGR